MVRLSSYKQLNEELTNKIKIIVTNNNILNEEKEACKSDTSKLSKIFKIMLHKSKKQLKN